MPPIFVIGNKACSSWSLRPWILLASFAIAFEEKVIPLYRDESKRKVLKYSPSGKFPALVDGKAAIFESLAVIAGLSGVAWRRSKREMAP